MSLDVYLRTPITTLEDECPCPHCPGHGQVGGDEVFTTNITHNLVPMAQAADLYRALWRPNESGYMLARDLIEPLARGLEMLRNAPRKYRDLNPENGWGSYEGLMLVVERYLRACEDNPSCTVWVSR